MKNRKLKQFLSLLLVLLFVVSLLPSAFAEEELPETVTEEPEIPAEEPEAGEPVPEDDDFIEQFVPKEELPDGIAGMPEGYVMSESTIAEKQALIDHDVLATLDNMTPGKDYVEDEVLVTAATEEEAQTIAAAYNAELLSFNGHFAVLRLTAVTVRNAVAAGMDMQLALPPVDPNYIITLDPVEYVDATVPIEDQNSAERRLNWSNWAYNDPLIQDPSGDYQYMHDMVNSYAAWGETRGWYPIVAVIDTGVDYTHEDLQSNWGGQKVIKGWDYVDNDNDPLDENGHGTHCAGIIAATFDNGVGGVGIAPEAEILAVRVLNAQGSGTEANILNGIYYAAEWGADILSLSLGGPGYSNAKQNAVNYANQQGATVIAAMGNDGTNIKYYPAALDGVIAVAAVNPSGERAPYSNYGKWCDIAAPGSDIWSTVPGNKYECWDGTSMATPVVAGAAALYITYMGHNPGPAKVEKALLAATNKCSSKECGKGIVDVAKLVSGLGTPCFNVWTYHYEYDEESDDVYGPYYDEYRGSSNDLKNAVISRDTLLELYVTPNSLESHIIIYTLDGTAPSYSDGIVKNGILDSLVFLDNYYPGDKVTLKMLYVNGLGVASKVSTYTFTIAPSAADSETLADTVVSVLAPKVMIPGKSVKLSAAIGASYVEEGYYDLDQSFTWKIVSNSGCPNAKIDAKTGKLTTKAGETGTVTVRATSVKYPSKYKNATVKIEKVNPISKITLDQKSVSLNIGEWAYVSVASLVDSKKNDVAVNARSYRWTSSNPKVAKVMQHYTDGGCEFQALGKGSATITCEVLDGSGKKATFKVNVAQPAYGIEISGQRYIAAGASCKYKATLTPKGTKEKVIWSLKDAPSGVTVDSAKGTVKVPTNVTSGTFVLHAETSSGYASSEYTIDIVPAKATSVNIINYHNWSSTTYPFVTTKNGNITAITLYCMNTSHDSNWENDIELKASVSNGSNPSWTSSNPKVVNVYGYSDGWAYLCANANGVTGTATVTCAAQDGSGKKATIKVTVVNPVSQIFVKSNNPSFRQQDDIFLAGIGKTAKNTAVFGTTYGKPTNKKVTWSYEVYQEVWSDGIGTVSSRSNITNQAKNNSWVKLSNSGALTVNKSIESKFNSYVTATNKYLVIYVYATSQDGTNVTGTARYVVTPLTKKLTSSLTKNTITLQVNNGAATCYVYNNLGGYYGDYTITSSNPDIAGAMVNKMYVDGIQLLVVSGRKTGTAKITIKANDGSNKSVTITVKVTK